MTILTKNDIGQPVIVYLLDRDPSKKKYGYLVDIDEETKTALVSISQGKTKKYDFDDILIDTYSANYMGTRPQLEPIKRPPINTSVSPKKKKFVSF